MAIYLGLLTKMGEPRDRAYHRQRLVPQWLPTSDDPSHIVGEQHYQNYTRIEFPLSERAWGVVAEIGLFGPLGDMRITYSLPKTYNVGEHMRVVFEEGAIQFHVPNPFMFVLNDAEIVTVLE